MRRLFELHWLLLWSAVETLIDITSLPLGIAAIISGILFMIENWSTLVSP